MLYSGVCTNLIPENLAIRGSLLGLAYKYRNATTKKVMFMEKPKGNFEISFCTFSLALIANEILFSF